MISYNRNGLGKIPFIISIAALLSFTSVTAYAAEAGRVQLNGKEVILNDDNTWQFAPAPQPVANTNCVKIKSKTLPVSVCLDEKVWQINNAKSAAEFSFISKDAKLFLLMITETDEVQLDNFEKAIVANAQKVGGLKPVLVSTKERINALGREWGRMVYDVDVDGNIFTFENMFTNLEGQGAVQYVFYAAEENYAGAQVEIEKVIKQIGVE